MRMLVNVDFPIEPFNSLVRSGRAGTLLGRIVDDIRPESVYFTEQNGHRGAVMVVEVPDAKAIPAIAEPWFLNFEAHCEFRIAMTKEDLMEANLNRLAEKWQDLAVSQN